MKTIFATLGALFVLLSSIQAPSQTSAYAGGEQREIKALSDQQVSDYLAGNGMGYARAAELNHYPGPKHALAMAEQLRLTSEQTIAAQKILHQMQADAQRLGANIVKKERALDALFASGRADPEAVSISTAQIAQLEGRLRAAHLQAHVAMRGLLTREQVRSYDQLRGYGHKHQDESHSH